MICRLEAGYLGLLKGVDGYEIDDGQLVLLRGNRKSIILKPAVASAS